MEKLERVALRVSAMRERCDRAADAAFELGRMCEGFEYQRAVDTLDWVLGVIMEEVG